MSKLFIYRALCKKCHTLYQSPRPNLSEFEAYYATSNSAEFWSKCFFPAVAEIRRVKIFQPRVEMLHKICVARKFSPQVIMDVGAGYGVFLEEMGKIYPHAKLCAVEPGRQLSEVCKNKGFEVLETIAEKAKLWHGKADIVTSFEVIEHVYDPLVFIKSLKDLVRKDGYVLISGLCIDGFDLQVLWEQSKSIMPPHHINFLSIDGFRQLFFRAGFQDVEILTPGELDFDIVSNNLSCLPDNNAAKRFVELILRRGQNQIEEFQKFLQNSKLSSHVWVFAKS